VVAKLENAESMATQEQVRLLPIGRQLKEEKMDEKIKEIEEGIYSDR